MSIYYNSEKSMMIDHTKRKGFFTMQDQHSHDEYELYYLFAGERDYFIRDRTYRVKQGSFVFVDKHELHRTIDTGVPDHERLVINFNDSFLTDFPFATLSGVITLPPQVQFKGENIVQELLSEAKDQANGRDIMLESLLRQLLLLVFRARDEQPKDDAQPSSVHQTMFEIATYVGTHYVEALRLHDVAAQFFISPYYLSRKFKHCTGFGFAQYVQLVRVREAQRLLRETNLKMNEIAEHIGMESVANFHKLFKHTTGCSPLQFRKRG
ncbi:MAG TPA: AraC family transcriptional regulator [Candidatus Paenibacillus intestinavium]|nr:AraC family transcriptional regulator [Candidatus Paenibacillus intestinavium]